MTAAGRIIDVAAVRIDFDACAHRLPHGSATRPAHAGEPAYASASRARTHACCHGEIGGAMGARTACSRLRTACRRQQLSSSSGGSVRAFSFEYRAATNASELSAMHTRLAARLRYTRMHLSYLSVSSIHRNNNSIDLHTCVTAAT